MGYSIWDRLKGGPANRKRYETWSTAEKACKKLNEKGDDASRFYIKPL